MLWLTLALVLVAGTLAWVALETRWTHQAIDAYVEEMRAWKAWATAPMPPPDPHEENTL